MQSRIMYPSAQKEFAKKPCPWITDEVVQVMKKRDHIYKVAVRQNDSHAWHEYKALRNRVTRMITKCNADYYQGLIREGTRNSKALWKCLNEITPRPGNTLPNTINDKDCASSTEIADAFNRHFFSSFDDNL